MPAHEVTQQTNGGRRRWVCTGCDWATEWTLYTDPGAAAEAIRHSIRGERDQ